MESTYDIENIFAKILRQEIPCDKIYEDDFVLAFKDINPQAPSHILVIPKGQYRNIKDFSEKATDIEIVKFYKAIGKVADLVNATEEGFRVISNHGDNGGQEVPHFHIHILSGKQLGPKLVRE